MANKQRDALAARTALLYYRYQKNQNEIANELGISRSYVSQLLTYAREMNMVKIHVNVDADFIKETEFVAEFTSLRYAYILESESDKFTKENIGTFASPHIGRLINRAQAIGINLGTAVQTVIDDLDESDFNTSSTRTVSQIMGGFSNSHSSNMMPAELVTRLANKTSSKGLYLNCPAIIENPSLKRDLLMEDSIARIIAFWEKLDLTIMGIGVVNSNSRIYSMLKQEMIDELNKSKACCEITLNYFDEKGKHIPVLKDNKISIPYENLKKVKTKVVIGHGKHKANAILSGLRAGMIDILITDSITVAEIEKLMTTKNI